MRAVDEYGFRELCILVPLFENTGVCSIYIYIFIFITTSHFYLLSIIISNWRSYFFLVQVYLVCAVDLHLCIEEKPRGKTAYSVPCHLTSLRWGSLVEPVMCFSARLQLTDASNPHISAPNSVRSHPAFIWVWDLNSGFQGSEAWALIHWAIFQPLTHVYF